MRPHSSARRTARRKEGIKDMRIRAPRALAITFVLALVLATAAFAAPLHGKTYVGAVPSKGIRTEHRHVVPIRAGGNITLKVAGNGKSVYAHFTSSRPVLYCNTGKVLRVQSAKPARITGSGGFKAFISERFNPGPGVPPIVQVVYGHFNGGSATGTIETRAGECSGVSYYSARAH
jgi:hypothetical protein